MEDGGTLGRVCDCVCAGVCAKFNIQYSGLQKPGHSLKRQGKDDMSSNSFRFLALWVNVKNCPLLRHGEREGLKINTPQAKGAGQEK